MMRDATVTPKRMQCDKREESCTKDYSALHISSVIVYSSWNHEPVQNKVQVC